MDWKNDDDLLAFDVKFALSQCRYRPPPRFNVDNPDAASIPRFSRAGDPRSFEAELGI